MKYLVIDHFKLPLPDSHHNLFHWLVVVLIRIIKSIFLFPFSFYLIAIGFALSAGTFQPHFPVTWFEKTIFYSNKLPYFFLIRNFLFFSLNHWYKDAPVWWTMVVGIPLIAMGICFFFITLFTLYYSIFSSIYNLTHCPFCKQSIKPVSS